MEGSPIPMPELPAPPATPEWPAIRSWRVRMRQALIGRRLALDGALRKSRGERARQRLLAAADLSRFATLGVYWPVRGEIDVLEIAAAHLARGGRVALPVVVQPFAPVEFWSWQPGVAMSRGVWNIPIPAQREVLVPDALIVPLVGFDARCCRLGYGGGYYDRTIAAAARRPWCVGLGFEAGRLESSFPQPHDIPMNLIVTDGAD
jgi:5-formyltetrahydrofolate cyclo-ligase